MIKLHAIALINICLLLDIFENLPFYEAVKGIFDLKQIKPTGKKKSPSFFRSGLLVCASEKIYCKNGLNRFSRPMVVSGPWPE